MKNTMEVLVLVEFEGTMSDELAMKMGDVIKNVTKTSEEGWLQGDLKGKRGIFPANFVKEIPAYLRGDSHREPRSIRTTKKVPLTRRCEATFPYKPMNDDELQLVPGEVIEIIREIEDGWWMGVRNNKVGAFPSNFVKEIFVTPKEGKFGEGKSRPKLSDAVFTKEVVTRNTSVRNKVKKTECCQVMFDYVARAEDELELKKGNIVSIIRKETDDEGWWEGELNGRVGFFPDNYVMVIPPMDSLQLGDSSQLPVRNVIQKPTGKAEASAMDKSGPAKTKDDKPLPKDLRSNPPAKVKLPSLRPALPPVKDKPNKGLPNRTNSDARPPSPKQPEQKESDKFDGVDIPVQTEKLSHPTADRAKPPQRRPPTGQNSSAPGATDQTEPETSPNKFSTDKVSGVQKTDSSSQAPGRPAPPKVAVDGKTVTYKDEPSVESLQAELKELRMALELFQTRQDRDMQEVKEELREERNKRVALQEEVQSLRMKQ